VHLLVLCSSSCCKARTHRPYCIADLRVIGGSQALEKRSQTAADATTGSAFTFMDDTNTSTSDHHGWEVSC
jgi:hypothetical protein